jgi:MYXO-CTERM domain-containing protein
MMRPCRIAPIVIAPLLGLLAGVCAGPRTARANGAFPESGQLILPADRPQQVVLATNFGLIISDDDGVTWNWTCEQQETMSGNLYVVGPPPADRFYSLSPLLGLAYSDDSSCSWKNATGTVETVVTTDYFPDPTDPKRVLALGAPPDLTMPPVVLPSDDGGATFKDPIYTGPDGAVFTGVEIARSHPQTAYVAMYTSVPAPGIHPKLAVTTDGGGHWDLLDLEPQIGANNFRIIAVDPEDDMTLSLRVVDPKGDFLAISHDGGHTFTKAFTIMGGSLTAYTKVDAMTILVGGIVLDKGYGFRSTDGGMTFQDWKQPTTLPGGTVEPTLHLRALGSRGGKVYAAAKNYSDSVGLAVSTDGGLTFRKLMSYEDVQSIRACAQATCFESCRYQASQQVWDAAVCKPKEPPPEAPESTLPEPPAKKTGCGCQMGDAGLVAGAPLVLFAAGWLARRPRRRRR